MLFLKFGKKEHLEQLKKGFVHFRPVEYFQNEPTSFRGDPMEGKLYLDPSKPFLINGIDFSHYIQEAVITYETEGNTLSFSASRLSKNNCHLNEDGTYSPMDSFIQEMSQFGEYFLLLNGNEFIDELLKVLVPIRCPASWHPIVYCDKNDHAKIQEVIGKAKENGNNESMYLFIKDSTYCFQNEWRMVIFDINSSFQIGTNGGVDIMTKFSTEMPIFRTKDLKTLQCSEEFLCD